MERIDGCKSSIETIIVPLKERIARTNFFGNKHTTAEIITQTMTGCKISRQNKNSILQRMDDCHPFDTETDTLAQRVDGFN